MILFSLVSSSAVNQLVGNIKSIRNFIKSNLIHIEEPSMIKYVNSLEFEEGISHTDCI